MTNHIDHLLVHPAATLPVDFRPSDMGVVINVGERRYHPEFRRRSDLVTRAEIAWPEFWAYDGSRICFDVIAPAGVRIEASAKPIEIGAS